MHGRQSSPGQVFAEQYPLPLLDTSSRRDGHIKKLFHRFKILVLLTFYFCLKTMIFLASNVQFTKFFKHILFIFRVF